MCTLVLVLPPRKASKLSILFYKINLGARTTASSQRGKYFEKLHGFVIWMLPNKSVHLSGSLCPVVSP